MVVPEEALDDGDNVVEADGSFSCNGRRYLLKGRGPAAGGRLATAAVEKRMNSSSSSNSSSPRSPEYLQFRPET